MSHPAVQNFLDKIWYGVLKKPEETLEYLRFTTSVVICNYFFFFLVAIPGLIKFEDQLKFKEGNCYFFHTVDPDLKNIGRILSLVAVGYIQIIQVSIFTQNFRSLI